MKLLILIPCLLNLMPLCLGFTSKDDDPGPAMEWTKAFSFDGNHELSKDSLLTTVPKMTKEWKVSFEIKPTDYSLSGYSNVLHLTIGGKGLGSSAKVGDRTPAIWIHKTRGVMISSALNGKPAYTKTIKRLPPAGEWTTIEVSQSLVGSKYMYEISIAGKTVNRVENTKPVELSNVKVYAGSPWYTATKGFLQNLEIEIKVPKIKGCVLAGKTHPIPIYQCSTHTYKYISKPSLFIHILMNIHDFRPMANRFFPPRGTPDIKQYAPYNPPPLGEGVEGLV